MVGARTRVVVAEVVPGFAVVAIVLADRAPLPFAKIGSPLLPGGGGVAGRVEALLFGGRKDSSGLYAEVSRLVIVVLYWFPMIFRNSLKRYARGRMRLNCQK